MERGPTSFVRTTGLLHDIRSTEIRLRKLKLSLKEKRFANHKAALAALRAATASVGMCSSGSLAPTI